MDVLVLVILYVHLLVNTKLKIFLKAHSFRFTVYFSMHLEGCF